MAVYFVDEVTGVMVEVDGDQYIIDTDKLGALEPEEFELMNVTELVDYAMDKAPGAIAEISW